MAHTPRNNRTRHGLNLTPRTTPLDRSIDEALAVIDRSGLAPALQHLADNTADGKPRRGRPRAIPKVRGLLAAFMLNGATPHHRGSLADINRHIHSMTPEQQATLEIPYSEDLTYDHLYRFLGWLASTLKAAPQVEVNGELVELDRFEFMNQLIAASTKTQLPIPEFRSVAADDTALKTWAALYGDPDAAQIVHDDDDSGYGNAPPSTPRKKGAPSQLITHGVDDRGFTIYTKDPDARASYATATNSCAGHKYVGYHLFLAVGTKSIVSTDGREQVTFGPAVPELILGAHLAPGGHHRGENLVKVLAQVKARHPKVKEVVCDAGFTGAKPHRFFHPVRQLGYDVMFEIKKNQGGVRPFAGNALCLDGGLFSPLLPHRLRGSSKGGKAVPLASVHWRAGSEARLEGEKAFNQRAPYALRRHSRPDKDGTMRFQCPFHAGRLRSLQVPHSMRAGHHVPLVVLPDDTPPCCPSDSGVISVSADDAIWWQPIPFGTTAWREGYGRKNTAEEANSELKGKYVNLASKYTQVMGLEKMTIFLAFAIAGYNLERLTAWEHKLEREAETKKTRAKRRTGTWHRDDAA